MARPTGEAVASSEQSRPLRLFWQSITIAVLATGYAGYYLCRSDLSVTLPIISAELVSGGMDPATARLRLGSIASVGVLAYALAKFASGSMADLGGGRRNFLLGMGGSAVFTLAFALTGGSLPLMTLAWVGNRGIQATGWAGIVKVASRWFSRKTYGTVMAVLSLSFLFGDAAARAFIALLLAQGWSWRGVFFMAASMLAALWLLTFCFLKETPLDIGQVEPEINPGNLYGSEGARSVPAGLPQLFGPMLRNPSFQVACFLSLGFTLVRETFNLWTPTYFTQVLGLSPAEAAAKSAVFPLVGGISVVLVGSLSDRLGSASRSMMMFGGLAASGAALLYLAFGRFSTVSAPIMLVALIGFLLIGPYSFLAGAVALDLGGRQGSATASGFIDGVGYLGGVLAGDSVARLSAAFGWSGAFIALGGVCFVSAAAALFYRTRGNP